MPGEYISAMRYVCDAGSKTWFEIETEVEAAAESQLMNHAVEKHFRNAIEEATASYVPPEGPVIEQNIGLSAHIRRVMPRFPTLRDADGMVSQRQWSHAAQVSARLSSGR
jgi:hypothetical protein